VQAVEQETLEDLISFMVACTEEKRFSDGVKVLEHLPEARKLMLSCKRDNDAGDRHLPDQASPIFLPLICDFT